MPSVRLVMVRGINAVFGIATEGSYWRKNRRSMAGNRVGLDVGRLKIIDRERPGDADVYGIDNNRNYAYAWGDDKMGSSSTIKSGTYRGDIPHSEAEPATSATSCATTTPRR